MPQQNKTHLAKEKGKMWDLKLLNGSCSTENMHADILICISINQIWFQTFSKVDLSLFYYCFKIMKECL